MNELRIANGLFSLEPVSGLMMPVRFTAKSTYNLGFFGHDHPVYGSNPSIARQLFRVSNVLHENIALARSVSDAFEGFCPLLSMGKI